MLHPSSASLNIPWLCTWSCAFSNLSASPGCGYANGHVLEGSSLNLETGAEAEAEGDAP